MLINESCLGREKLTCNVVFWSVVFMWRLLHGVALIRCVLVTTVPGAVCTRCHTDSGWYGVGPRFLATIPAVLPKHCRDLIRFSVVTCVSQSLYCLSSQLITSNFEYLDRYRRPDIVPVPVCGFPPPYRYLTYHLGPITLDLREIRKLRMSFLSRS
jgi:hypothetical protein